MNAEKVTCSIVVETLHIDSLRVKILEAAQQIEAEILNGRLTSEDGDTVSWNISRTLVTI